MNKELMSLCEVLNKKLANVAGGFSLLKDTYITHGHLKPDMMVSRRTGETVSDYMCKIAQYIRDMETFVEQTQQHEADISALKPFNIESAKSGAQIWTRDGRRARLLCVDAKNNSNRNVVALVADGYGEYPICYDSNGRCNKEFEDESDLFMLPNNREGWINIYPNDTLGDIIFEDKESAIEQGNGEEVDTIKIEWEE